MAAGALLLWSAAAMAQTIGGGGTGNPVGPAGGDLGGTYPNPSVVQVNGGAPGGTCSGSDFVNAINSSGQPSCGTPAGSGTVTQVTAGQGLGTAAGTCGSGDITTTGTLFQCATPTTYTADHTVTNSEGSSVIVMNSGTAKAFTFGQPSASSNQATGWAVNVLNQGAGALTLTPTSSTITPTLPSTLAQGQSVSLISDGTNYKSFGLSLAQIAADSVVMNATGSTAYPTAAALVSCSGASNALTYNTGTHAWGCNTITGTNPAYGFVVSNNGGSLPSPPTGTAMQFASADSVTSYLVGNAFAASAGLLGTRADGTSASPTAVAANSVVAFLSARPYDGSAYPANSTANLQLITLEAQSGSAHGAGILANCTAITTTTTAECLRLTAAGMVLGSSTANQAPRAALDIGSNLKATGVKVFNADGTNSEDGFLKWTSNAFQIGTEKGGSGTARPTQIVSVSRIDLNAATGTQINMQVNSTTIFDVTSTVLESNTAGGMQLTAAAASSTVPTLVPNKASATTGFGAQASGNISGIIAGTEMTRLSSTGLTMQAGLLVLKGFTVGGLPAGTTGGLAYVTDANAACVFGTTPVGGGSTVCKVWYNGTAWVEG